MELLLKEIAVSKLFAALLLSMASLAAYAVPFDPTYPIAPYAQASWFVPSESGSGFLFGMLPTTQPTLFGAYYTYGQSGGDSSWLVFQGAYTLNSDRQRVQTGVIATASSPLYEGSSGPCLSCPYAPPTVQANNSVGPATIMFPSTTRMQFQFAGGTKTLVPLDIATVKSLPDLLPGTWTGAYRSKVRFDTPITETACHIKIAKTTNPTSSETFTKATPDVREIPAPNSIYFKADPIPTTGNLCGVAINEVWFGMDPNTFATNVFFFGLTPTAPDTNVIPAGNGIHDVFFLGPNTFVIRYYRLNQIGYADMEVEWRFERDTTP